MILFFSSYVCVCVCLLFISKQSWLKLQRPDKSQKKKRESNASHSITINHSKSCLIVLRWRMVRFLCFFGSRVYAISISQTVLSEIKKKNKKKLAQRLRKLSVHSQQNVEPKCNLGCNRTVKTETKISGVNCHKVSQEPTEVIMSCCDVS